MKVYRSYLLILAMMTSSLSYGDGVVDLVAKAQKGDAAAQMELGVIYSKGEGVTKDLTEAVKWLTKAAEQGNVEAQMKLGGMYISGKGVLRSSSEAAKWFTMSANVGNAAAQTQLGRMHLTGAGVPKDDVEAYKWVTLAAAQGDPAAKKVIAFLLTRMTPLQIAEGKQRSQVFMDLKNAVIPLDLPTDATEIPVEALPLLVPEH